MMEDDNGSSNLRRPRDYRVNSLLEHLDKDEQKAPKRVKLVGHPSPSSSQQASPQQASSQQASSSRRISLDSKMPVPEMDLNIPREVTDMADELSMNRRHLHMHPETAFEEVKTAEFIKTELEKYGIAVKTGIGKTGVVGLLKGKKKHPCIALRADMDALPIQEIGDQPYKSKIDGKMHACGHDGHTAMLLGAAKLLAKKRNKLKGSVKFIFQPAEENGNAGAKEMIKDGVLKNPSVDEIYGMHIFMHQPQGSCALNLGPFLASSDFFDIILQGKGGHGGNPQGTQDVIMVAGHLISQVHSIVSRTLSPLDAGVITIGKIAAGYAPNTIADTATFSGTTRACQPEVRDMLEERLRSVVQGIEVAYGVTAQLDYRRSYGPTINTSKECWEVARAACSNVVGENNVIDLKRPQVMAAEDFSFYLAEVPGHFFHLGATEHDDWKDSVGHHNPHFDFAERTLAIGVAIWLQIVERLLS